MLATDVKTPRLDNPAAHSFGEVTQFMADPDFAACFGQVIVEHARMLRQDRQVEFTLRSAAPLDQNLCARLLASLQPDYEGFELKIKNLFGYAMLDEHALRILLEDMKRDGVPINGFLDRSSITITGQNITVGVCHGTKFLQEMGFEELLAKRVAEHTGVTPKVTLQSAVTAAEQQQMEEKLERKIAPPVVKFEKKNTAPSIKVEGCFPLFTKTAQEFSQRWEPIWLSQRYVVSAEAYQPAAPHRLEDRQYRFHQIERNPDRRWKRTFPVKAE